MTYEEECQVCGEEGDFLDHGHVDVVSRDGWRGQYLGDTFVLDVRDILGESAVDIEVARAAARRIREMHYMDAHDSTEQDAELVYEAIDDLEQKLFVEGYVAVWDDGYVIYKINGTV